MTGLYVDCGFDRNLYEELFESDRAREMVGFADVSRAAEVCIKEDLGFMICVTDKRIFDVMVKVGWKSYKIGNITVVRYGEKLRLAVCYKSEYESLFTENLFSRDMDISEFCEKFTANAVALSSCDSLRNVRRLLGRIGMYPNLIGYGFILDAVRLAYRHKRLLNRITTELYPRIADSRGVSVKAVERDIRNAIEVSFGKGKIYKECAMLGGYFDKYERPTNGSFIAFLTTVV